MNTKHISTQGHSFLPLAIRIKQSAHNDTHFVEALINGGVFEDRVAQGIDQANKVAANLMTTWVARLTPAFEAGRASCTCAQAQHRLDDEDRAGYLTEREAYTRRLRADISPEEAAEELMGDPDEWDGQ